MDTAGVIQLCILVVLIMLFCILFFCRNSIDNAESREGPFHGRGESHEKSLNITKDSGQKSKLISAILIGNNIVNISASSLMTSLVIRIWGNAAVGIATGVLTLLILLFGEIVPKTWAMYNNENLALAYSSPIYFLMQVLTPIIFIIDKLSGFLLKLLHIDSSKTLP